MNVERLKPEDCPRIAEIYNAANEPFLEIYNAEEMEAYKDHLHETAESIAEMAKSRNIVVAKEEGFILGYAVFRIKNAEVVWISSLFVDPVLQKKGVGTLLLGYVEAFARENKCQLIALETHKDASWAIGFYIKNGYEDVRDKIEEYPYSMILEKSPTADRPLLAKKI